MYCNGASLHFSLQKTMHFKNEGSVMPRQRYALQIVTGVLRVKLKHLTLQFSLNNGKNVRMSTQTTSNRLTINDFYSLGRWGDYLLLDRRHHQFRLFIGFKPSRNRPQRRHRGLSSFQSRYIVFILSTINHPDFNSKI